MRDILDYFKNGEMTFDESSETLRKFEAILNDNKASLDSREHAIQVIRIMRNRLGRSE